MILLLCDRTLPVLPLLFPENRESELPSLGSALTALEIGTGEILAASVVCREYPNLLFLGYGIGENLYSYPETGEGRAGSFLDSLAPVCDCLIVDCSSVLYEDRLSAAAMKTADRVIRVYSPEMRSFAFYDSQLPLLEGDEWRADEHIRVLNITSNDIYFPVDESRANMLRCDAVLPYSRSLRLAMSEGRLIGANPGKKYRAGISGLVSVLSEKKENTGAAGTCEAE